MKKEKKNLLRIRRGKIAENLSRLRFNWWCYQPAKVRHFLVVFCLCDMCHQNRRSPPGLTPSDFDSWCDECYVDFPLWIKNEKTTAEELVRLAQKKKDEEKKRLLEREKKARIQNAKKKKKVKLTGFENVKNENDEEPTKESEVKTVVDASVETQRQQLESIYFYKDDDN